MKWYLRPDILTTLALLPLTVVLSWWWGTRINLDLSCYLLASLGIVLISTVPTFCLFVVVRLLRGEARGLLKDQLRLGGFFLNAALLTAVSWIYSHIKVGVLLGPTHDALLLQLDRTLFGVDPWVLCRQIVPHECGNAIHWIYMLFLPVLIGTVFWLTLSGRQALSDRLSGALVVAYNLGVLAYFLIPAYGPAYVVESARPVEVSHAADQVQRMLLVQTAAVHSDRSCAVVVPWAYIASFPSLHFSHVLILAWYLRRNRVGFALAAVFALLTGFSTIYLGWHYVVDLVGGAMLAVVVVVLLSLWRVGVESRRYPPAFARPPLLRL